MINSHTFEAIFKASPSAFLILRPDAPHFTIAGVNEAYLLATGTREEDLIGRGIFEAFPDNPDEAGATGVRNLRASLEQVIAHREKHAMAVQKYDIPVRGTGKFELRYWSPVNSPVLNGQGEVDFIVHYVSDVTEQVMAEEKVKDTVNTSNERIRYNDKRFRTLMQNSAEGIALMNADKAVVEASLSAFKILGMEGTDPSQLSFALVHPDDLPVALGAFEAALERPGEMRSAEIRVLSADKEYKWIEVCYHNQLSEPAVEAVVTNFREITDRKLAMEKVEASERRFRTLLQNSADGLVLVAADGTMLEISNSGRKIFRYPDDEMIGRLRPDLIHPDDLAMVGQAFIDVREHPEKVVCFQYRFLSPDGSYRWIEANFQNQLGEPAVGAMVMNFRDVTERIDHIRAIEEQNLKLREIAWMQSHIVRAPLSRMLGLVDVMRNYPDHVNGRELLEALHASANELDKVIRKIVKQTEAVDNNSLNGTPPGD